jgi:hypothetical protein
MLSRSVDIFSRGMDGLLSRGIRDTGAKKRRSLKLLFLPSCLMRLDLELSHFFRVIPILSQGRVADGLVPDDNAKI